MSRRKIPLRIYLDPADAEALDSRVPGGERSALISRLIHAHLESEGAYEEIEARHLLAQAETFRSRYHKNPEEVIAKSERTKKEKEYCEIYSSLCEICGEQLRSASTNPEAKQYLLHIVQDLISSAGRDWHPETVLEWCLTKQEGG